MRAELAPARPEGYWRRVVLDKEGRPLLNAFVQVAIGLSSAIECLPGFALLAQGERVHAE